MGRRVLRRVLRRGSKKGLSRRHLEGRSTHCREYDPVGVRPTLYNASRAGNCLELRSEVALNVVVRRITQMSAKEHKHKSAKERKS